MLPKRLEIRNFLAYRTPDPLLFDDLHLACLSGDNGAGKSSLLDAITWALWGKARARSDDDLVHLGESEMQVMLDFSQNGHDYRVIRKRKIGKARKSGGRSPGQGSLELFTWDDAREAFSLISEPSMRETQARINVLLRLDYDVFINSAFLQQGNAAAFTTKTPAQRKEILSEILGLGQWGLYEERAKARLDDSKHQVAVLAASLDEIEKEIAREPGFLREQEDAQAQLSAAQEAVQQAEESLDEVKGAEIELRTANEALAATQMNLSEREKDLQNQNEVIAEQSARLATLQTVLDDAERIQTGYAELEAARAADYELGNKLQDLNEVNARINALERQLDDARQVIELDAQRLQTHLQNDAAIIDNAAAARASLANIDAQIEELNALQAAREAWQAEITAFKEESAALSAHNETLYVEMADIKKRLEVLTSSTEAICPVCGQALDEHHKAELHASTTAEGTERGDQFRANDARLKEIKEAVQERTTRLGETKGDLARLPRLQNQRGGYEQQIQMANEAESRMQANQAKLDHLNMVLAEGDFGEAIRRQLVATQAERAALGYDRDEHTAVREKMNTYLAYQDEAQQLEFAQKSVPDLKAALEKAQAWRERLQKNIADYQATIETQQADIAALEVRYAEMQRRREVFNRQRSVLRNAEEKMTIIQQQLRSIATQRQRREEMLARRDALEGEATLYEWLKGAFGRNGIPAMLIDAAIPELEEEANRLLSRMTNNRMHLRFDTQREKKTGGVAETLDIWIQDELGQRDYQLYSGGEAFRVNFAIRVALSQMLARRAGAQLRALFIDEGFGTQDAAGRERLVEAITSIQDEFDLVLVITHIDELKEAFPARIEVIKTPSGSLAHIR
ncbi:MAG: AAA family ATPase [Anaerolineales bacterium]